MSKNFKILSENDSSTILYPAKNLAIKHNSYQKEKEKKKEKAILWKVSKKKVTAFTAFL